MRVLLFKEYETGYNNRLMSLELAVGLAHLTGRTLSFYQSRKNGCYAPRGIERLAGARRTPSLLDLLEPIPVAHADPAQHLGGQEPAGPDVREQELDLTDSVFVADAEALDLEAEERLDHFRELRSVVRDVPERVWHLSGVNLAFYSRFFFQPSAGLHDVLRRVRVQAPYRDLAETIAASLGEFDGVHVRRTDFREAHPRQARAPRRIRRTLRSILPGDRPVVVCTDEPKNGAFLDAILGRTAPRIILDDFVLREFRREFEALPFHDHVALGVVCNLVMWRCRRFAGTPGSTYSAVIHREWLRNRLAAGDPPAALQFRFLESGLPHVRSLRTLVRFLRGKEALGHFQNGVYLETRLGPFTWNRVSMPLHTAAKSWWREWPEALPSPSPEAGGRSDQVAQGNGAPQPRTSSTADRLRP